MVYRFWRDIGYAAGALIGGLVATFASLTAAIWVAAALTAASAVVCQLRMAETHPHSGQRNDRTARRRT